MTDSLLTSYKPLLLLVPAAYLIGSIPFGVLVSRGKGIDLTKTGSRNIGATNVLRTSGTVPALFTLAGDSLKGAAAVLICRYYIIFFVNAEYPVTLHIDSDLWEGLVGLSVVLGHIFSVFLAFRGGKGVATGFGVFAVYSPIPWLMGLLVWVLMAAIIRYSSLAAIGAFVSLPFILFCFRGICHKDFFWNNTLCSDNIKAYN